MYIKDLFYLPKLIYFLRSFYLMFSDVVRELIFKVNPNLKIFIVICDLRDNKYADVSH